jgi:hypothetical protein
MAAVMYAGDNHGHLPPRCYAGWESVDDTGELDDYLYIEEKTTSGGNIPRGCNIGIMLVDGHLANYNWTQFFGNDSAGVPRYYEPGFATIRWDPGFDVENVSKSPMAQAFPGLQQSHPL